MPNIKTHLLIFLLLELLLSYTPALAQTAVYDYSQGGKNPVSSQIEKYLCAPSPVNSSETNITNRALTGQTSYQNQAAFNNNNSGDLYKCINQLYKFAIVVAAVVGVFFIVIAGYVYMSAEGNTESVDKAKSILVSSLASLIILMIGYVLLKAINPDLIQFHSIQPPSVVGGAVGTPVTGPNGIPTTGGTDYYILAGFNIGPYATAPSHEQLVTQIYNSLLSKDFSSAASIDQYLKRTAPSTSLTGSMVFSSAQKYGVDAKVMVALMQTDSSLGTAGDRAIQNHNPGNVGNTDNGANRYFNSWNDGVDAVADWLNRHRA